MVSTTKVYPASTTTESPSLGNTTPPQVLISDHKLPYLKITLLDAKLPLIDTLNRLITVLVDKSLNPTLHTIYVSV